MHDTQENKQLCGRVNEKSEYDGETWFIQV